MTGLPTQIIPCCIEKIHIESSVDCLSPAGNDETVNPVASFPLSVWRRHIAPVESMNVLNGPDTPPR